MQNTQSTTKESKTAIMTDKRWRIVDARMRKLGYSPSALIETLHTVQRTFGYLDKEALRCVAESLHVPTSKVYGVATFYNHFRLKPEGLHTCVVCLGTACYIKGAAKLLLAAEQRTSIRASETTPDGNISLLTARCLGACGIAPAAVFDGVVVGSLTSEGIKDRIEQWMHGQ
jgi:bidirectional [NiFe] hydrogenase diaphorase subunit